MSKTDESETSLSIISKRERERERKIRDRLSSILVSVHFHPMERKVLYVLADGLSHSREELIKVGDDPTWTPANLTSHIQGIRERIKPFHHAILCEARHRKYYYRYVVLLDALL